MAGAIRLRIGALAVLLLAACRGRDGAGRGYVVPGDAGPAIVAEVLNASGRPGLARVGTRVLRRAGIDVVNYGNAPAERGILDSTEIVVRRGAAARGELVQRALKVGRVTVAPDTARLIDVSVFLGADFAPPLEFHP